MAKSTRSRLSRKAKVIDKPPKPYPEFPLTPHNSGAWMKKIMGKIHYFGKWAHRVNGNLLRVEGDGWKEALELYKVQADDQHAGRTPLQTLDCSLARALSARRTFSVSLRGWIAGRRIQFLRHGHAILGCGKIVCRSTRRL
jgi:hypothetical protein